MKFRDIWRILYQQCLAEHGKELSSKLYESVSYSLILISTEWELGTRRVPLSYQPYRSSAFLTRFTIVAVVGCYSSVVESKTQFLNLRRLPNTVVQVLSRLSVPLLRYVKMNIVGKTAPEWLLARTAIC